ncbi:MAG: helix-turn-helix domain-containing protein [Candidatus Omnitrophota bacterium]
MNPIIKPISVVLKEARQNKGISLEEAHKVTKIHPQILRSLEDGTTLGLSHVYVKSYIKIYAKYLGINQHELDKYFLPSVPKEKKVNIGIPFKTKGIKIKNLSNLQFLSYLKLNFKRFRKPIIISIVSILVLILLLVIISKFTKKEPKDAIVLKKVTLENKPITVKDSAEEKVKEALATNVDDILRLTIFAKEDTWMQIKKDGEVVFKRILKKSTSETWQAKESLELWLANAGTIEIELNGKILPPLGRRGQLLKSVLITKDGLAIKK